MKKTLEEQIRAAQKEGANWKTKAGEIETTYKRTLVNSAIKDAAIDPGSRASTRSAIPDILSRAQGVWRARTTARCWPTRATSSSTGPTAARR
jgi:hypothetical protein